MRVLLINPAMNLQKLGRFAGLLEPMPCIGLAYIAAALEQHGCVAADQPHVSQSPLLQGAQAHGKDEAAQMEGEHGEKRKNESNTKKSGELKGKRTRREKTKERKRERESDAGDKKKKRKKKKQKTKKGAGEQTATANTTASICTATTGNSSGR